MEKFNNPSVGRDADKFNLRLPSGMRDAIAEAAKSGGRSMNTEIVDRLEKSLTDDPAKTVNAVLMHVGLIQYLARCVEEIALMVPPNEDTGGRIAAMLEVARVLTADSKA